MITGIHHVSLKCYDERSFSKVVAFYTDLLGLKVLRSWGEGDDAGVMLAAGSDILEIFAKGQENDVTGSINHFGFYTDDVDGLVEKVRAEGYRVTMEPCNMDLTLNQPVMGQPYNLHIAFVVGPLGESIELFSER